MTPQPGRPVNGLEGWLSIQGPPTLTENDYSTVMDESIAHGYGYYS